MDDDSAKPRNVDISRYIEGGTRLSAEELRPGLSAITFQADIYMCVCVSRSIERVDSIQEIDVRFEQATIACVAIAKRERRRENQRSRGV